MESGSNVEKKWRTRQEKDALIKQWIESGKSRKVFCAEHGLSYNSFVSWHKEQKDKAKVVSGFSEVIIPSTNELFAQLHLPGGIQIDFFQPMTGEFIRSLIK
ncbi:MAG: transposase [Bacteroidetes bacterium]|nr:transposase [Bacteroidota bacterium]